MKNKTLSIATLLLTGALLFAGCGQTGNTTGNTSSTTAGQETATTEQTDSTAQTASDSTASTNDIFTNMDTTDIDGNKMDSSIFAKNKVTLVNVWNVGCTPCVNEIPDLDKINSEYKDKGAAVYGLYGDLGMGISDDEMAQIKDIMSNANFVEKMHSRVFFHLFWHHKCISIRHFELICIIKRQLPTL